MPEFNGAAAIAALLSRVESGAIEVYNEISLQLELGHFLRTTLGERFAVEFERPAHHFGAPQRLTKKEIDLAIVERREKGRRWAIELKVPRNGQYPEQMFSACKDIQFLEELCFAGFDAGWFVMLVDSPPFYSSALPATGIYGHFRGMVPIHGRISKPTGHRHEELNIRGSYLVRWQPCGQGRYMAVIEVRPDCDDQD